ncbi:hypothetical protein KCU95_g3728, partial [Aureobasidium melanogenum]
MAQSAPTNIDLSSLWSDGTGQTPNGAEFSQILRGTDRYNEYLEYVTRGCNRNAQMVAQYGRIKLTGDLPQGYTLWVQDTGGKKTVLWLYGHPRGNFRSALNFSDHIPEMLAANDARERRIRAEVKATNDEKAREDIRQNNKDALLYNAVFGDQFKQYNEDEQLHVSPHTFFTEQQANDAVLADRQTNPIIDPVVFLIQFQEHSASAQSMVTKARLSERHYITVISARRQEIKVYSQGPENSSGVQREHQ